MDIGAAALRKVILVDFQEFHKITGQEQFVGLQVAYRRRDSHAPTRAENTRAGRPHSVNCMLTGVVPVTLIRWLVCKPFNDRGLSNV